jgi:formylglycine-generating enzyme required for sulfatase activity/serine/threonine protein kinase
MVGDHVNALRVGHQLEEYAVERLLGHGGFGLTYLARDTNLNNLVAIKEYLPQEYAVRAANSTIVPKSQSDEGAYQWGLERFKQEARSLARFKHPNIVRAARLIEANGTAYMVMEYEHGLTLGEYLKRFGPTMDEGLILGVFLPILEGLAALHRAEFIHRDIKPGNIYLREEGGPMLIDFGAVRQAVGVHSQSLTSVVTPGYAPIEQYSSEGRQGPWTDLYAVGAAMYCCVLGRSPVDAARRSAAISDGDKDPLVSAVRIGKEKGKYSDAILESIDWAMQFRGKDRPQTAAELKQRMQQSPVPPTGLTIPTLKDMDETWVGFRPDAASGGPRSQSRSAPPSRPPSQPPSVPPEGDGPTSLAPDISREPTRAAPRPPPVQTVDSGAEIGSAPVEWFGDTPSVPQMPPATPMQTPVQAPAAPAATKAPRDAERAGSVVAQPSASRAAPEPPARSRAPAVLGALLLLAAAGAGGWWWNQQRELEAQDTLLFEGAVAAASPEAYRAYLDNCVRCAQRAAAERAIERLETERQSAADAVAQREVAEKIAELKARFARHVLAGELTSGPEGSAREALDDLAIVAPDDPFVAEGRSRLAELESLAAKSKRGAPANGKTSKAVPAQAPPPAVAATRPAASQTADDEPRAGRGDGRKAGATDDAKAPAKADAPASPIADAGKAPAAREPAKEPVARAEEPKSAPAKSAAEERAAQLAQIMDRLAKFEIALARNELGNAGQALKELGTLAPDDALVKDAQRRYDGVQAKQAQQRADEQRKREEAARAVELQRIADAALAAARQAAPAAAPATAPAAAPSRPIVSVAGGTSMRDALPGGAQGPLLIVVPGGAFRLGDTSGTGARDEQPVRRVEIPRAFAIGRREVTVAEFRAFADATAYRTDAERTGGCRIFTEDGFRQEARYSWRRLPFSQADDEPVVCVSWSDALTYTQWLARATGKPYRLPTEAEWEYAARAGTESAYWWGNTVNAGRANCEGCGGRAKLRTLPVQTFSPNAFGLYDTAGNAFEWTCSAYAGSYAGQEQQCAAAGAAADRVMRGGSWAMPPPRVRASFRGFAARDYASDNVGFRVLLEL